MEGTISKQSYFSLTESERNKLKEIWHKGLIKGQNAYVPMFLEELFGINFLTPISSSFTDENGVEVDLSLKEEEISIYKPNGELLITSSNPLIIDSIRLQIYEKDLKGYTVVGESGLQVKLEKDTTYFHQGKGCQLSGKIIKIKLDLGNDEVN